MVVQAAEQKKQARTWIECYLVVLDIILKFGDLLRETPRLRGWRRRADKDAGAAFREIDAIRAGICSC